MNTDTMTRNARSRKASPMGWLRWLVRPKGPKWMNPIERRIPYPLRAAKFSLDFNPFGFWLKPRFHRRKLTEDAKKEGETQWYFRWAWFQISFSRWV